MWSAMTHHKWSQSMVSIATMFDSGQPLLLPTAWIALTDHRVLPPSGSLAEMYDRHPSLCLL